MPRDVGEYLDAMPHSAATKKLHLAALRHFFDVMVSRHAIMLNPAASVRGPRLQVIEGKTPEIGIKQARRLLKSIEKKALADPIKRMRNKNDLVGYFLTMSQHFTFCFAFVHLF